MPTDARGVYEAYAPGIDYTAESGLAIYQPTFHPWSIYRIDQQAGQIAMLLDHALGTLEISSCADVYRTFANDPDLAGKRPDLATAV